MKMKMKRKRALSIILTAVLLVLTVAVAVPSASADVDAEAEDAVLMPENEDPKEADEDAEAEELTEPADLADGAGYLVGDANSDWVVDILDVLAIQCDCIDMGRGIDEVAADVDLDSDVSIADATAIQRFLAEIPVAHEVNYWVSTGEDTNEADAYASMADGTEDVTTFVGESNVAVNKTTVPTITKCDSVDTGVKITFDKVSGVNNYAVYYKGRNGWTRMGTTTSNTFIDTVVKSGTKYTYTVRGLSNDGKSFTTGYNSKGWVYTYNMATPQITGLSDSDAGIKITWGAVPNARRYRVYYYGSKGWTLLGDTSNTSYLDYKVRYGNTYTYTVRCVNSKNSRFTSSYNSKGWKYTYYLPTPSITGFESTDAGVKITWDKVKGAASYRVFYKGRNGWTRMGNTTGTSFTDTDVASGKTYTYVVRCTSRDGSKYTSDYDKNGTKYTYNMDTPVVTSIKSTAKGNVLTWGAVKEAILYRVFEKVGKEWKGIGNTISTSFTDVDVKYDATKTYTVRCVSSNGKRWTSGYNSTGWSKKYDYEADVKPTEAPTEGASTKPTEASTKPTEASTKPTESVQVVSGTKGVKNYEKAIAYELTSNLSAYSNVVIRSLVDPEPIKDKILKDDSYIDASFEYLDNGKVRVHFKPNAPDKIEWVRWWIKNDSEESIKDESKGWFKAADIPLSAIKNGSGYYDYQMPEREDERVYPSVNVSWGKSSNAEGYDVVIKDAKGNAVSKVVTVGKNATSATVQLTTFDAGTFTAEVTAKSGKNTAVANGTFAIKSSFIEDKAAEVIKTPIVEYVEGVCVCNNCGMAVTGKVKDHIITDREYQIMMTEEPIYYDGKTLAAGWCGYHYFTSGGATIPIRTYYWENAPHFYKGGNQRDFNPVFTTGRIEQLASHGWREDGTFGPYEHPNPHPELTCTRDWCFGPKGVLFTESQMLEMLSSEESRFYGVNDAEALLEDDMSFYHGYVQGCSAGYHMEDRSRITGLTELHVPATGHYEFTVN